MVIQLNCILKSTEVNWGFVPTALGPSAATFDAHFCFLLGQNVMLSLYEN